MPTADHNPHTTPVVGPRPPSISLLSVEKAALDPRGVRPARLALLLATLAGLLWHPLLVHLVPGAQDPLVERLGLCGLGALLLAATANRRGQRHLAAASQAMAYVATAHAFSLAVRNGLVVPYLVALRFLVVPLTLCLGSVPALLAYSGTVMALAVVAGAIVPADGWWWVVALGTAEALVTALAWRHLALAKAARERIRQASGFLGAIVDSLPDPVFVLDGDLSYLLANEAMGAVTNALAELDAHAALAGLPAGLVVDAGAGAVERELALPGLAGGPPRTALAKLAWRQLPEGERYLVGIIRDISERKALEQSLHEKVRELEEARRRVKQLQGLLPVCMHCGRIRAADDWQDLQSYVENHSEATFSHGLCETCMEQHYP